MVKDVYFGNTLRKSFARKQEITGDARTAGHSEKILPMVFGDRPA